MGKMLKNEVAKNELKEVRHSEEWHKSGEKVKYRLADAMKSCMKKAPVEKMYAHGTGRKNNRKRNCRNLWVDASDILSEFSG